VSGRTGVQLVEGPVRVDRVRWETTKVPGRQVVRPVPRMDNREANAFHGEIDLTFHSWNDCWTGDTIIPDYLFSTWRSTSPEPHRAPRGWHREGSDELLEPRLEGPLVLPRNWSVPGQMCSEKVARYIPPPSSIWPDFDPSHNLQPARGRAPASMASLTAGRDRACRPRLLPTLVHFPQYPADEMA